MDYRHSKKTVLRRIFGGLGKTLNISFLTFALIPMTLIGFFSYFTAYDSLDKQIRADLVRVTQLKTREINLYFNKILAELQFQSETEINSRFLETLIKERQKSRKRATEFVRSYDWALAVFNQSADIRAFRRGFNFSDIYLIDGHGDVLFSVAEKSDLGTNVFAGQYSNTRFASAVKKTLETGDMFFSDYDRYQPSKYNITGFITSPVTDSKGDPIGVMALQIPIDPITHIMKGGLSGKLLPEIYLIGEDLTLRSSLTGDRSRSLIDEPIETEQTLKFQSYLKSEHDDGKKERAFIYDGPFGNRVLGTHNSFHIKNVRFSVIAEIDEQEAFESIYNLRRIILTFVCLTGLVIIFFVMTFVKKVVQPVLALRDATQKVSRGDYSEAIQITAKNEIGALADSFMLMVKSLKTSEEGNKLREWHQKGLMDLNDTMQGNQDLPDLCDKTISFLAGYTKAEIGAFYIAKSDGSLQLAGSYAFSAHEKMPDRINPGQGVVGQAALEKERILLTDVPKDYIAIKSGTGGSAPHTIVVKPLIREGSVLGVIELGSFTGFSEKKLDFIDAVSEPISIAVLTLFSHTRVQELLKQSQSQTEELKASEEQLQVQQEELRQANEELEEYTDALKKSESRLQDQQNNLQQSNEELEEKTERLEIQKSEIELTNEDLQKAQTEIEDKARELELSSRYKSEFLANMSHELRTPLNSILLLSKLFVDNRDGRLNEDQIESAEAIHSSGNDLLKLINEILDLSKIESGKMELLVESLNLPRFTETLARSFRHFTDQKGLKLITEITDNVPTEINTDSQRLEQILKNFFSNAIKFTAEGQIALNVSSPNPETYKDKFPAANGIPEQLIAISVADTGIGIPEDKQKLIFEAFQQADGSTSRRFGGTGLGLSISRELALKLGGFVQLESEEGVGSTFTLIIPSQLQQPEGEKPLQPLKTDTTKTSGIPEQAVAATLEPAPASILTGPVPVPKQVEDDRKTVTKNNKSILVIEDDPTFARILRNVSHEHGFKCLIAHSGETGLQFADLYQPSAIVLDIGLPGIDGWAVMDRLKTDPSTRHIPVHFISAADREKNALNMGAVDFLTKPVSPVMLERAFENIERIITKKVKDLLVIEDSPQQVLAIRKLIGNGDVVVTSVDNAEDGFREICTDKYDCVILDLRLPDSSGIQLLSRIRNEESYRYLPIIVYTGKELETAEINVINQYAETTITKGVNSHQRLLDETTLFLHRVEKDLPIQQQKQIRMLHDKEAVLEGKTVLVVDDDMRNVFSIKKILEENQITVLVGKNGREGIEKLEEHQDTVDLVLMDIMMPIMDGYEALRTIRQRESFKKLPMIALTAKAMKGDKAKCIEAGANDYLAKPLDVDRLLSMLRVWLYN